MAQELSLSGALPGEDTNGLKTNAKALLEDPRRFRLVVAVVDIAKTTIKHDKNIQIPTVRVRHIELVSDKNAAAVQKILAKELSARTGAEQLPFPHGDEGALDFEGDDSWNGGDPDAARVDPRSDEERAGEF